MPSLNTFCNLQSAALKHLIKEAASDSANLVNPDSDFSRSRKLSVLDLAAVAYQTEDRSINRSLPTLPDSLADLSLSAISQARQKIKHSLYSNVFHKMNDLFYHKDDKTFYRWRLLSVDGSEIPDSPDGNDMSTYGESKKGFDRLCENSHNLSRWVFKS
ncbi:hypothetical protein [Allobaculum mucilyticum]|uniref:hypothetical protein n=1 Tax=Allobaculum mucilyticum TaxID=2834459 RepID=UPI001E4C7ACE|nr:hypothetical protein [Allobaculum mucilyticum]UNT96614.1 hypothetical protein KWG62_02310 [Allobaculum mucilyticum]